MSFVFWYGHGDWFRSLVWKWSWNQIERCTVSIYIKMVVKKIWNSKEEVLIQKQPEGSTLQHSTKGSFSAL